MPKRTTVDQIKVDRINVDDLERIRHLCKQMDELRETAERLCAKLKARMAERQAAARLPTRLALGKSSRPLRPRH